MTVNHVKLGREIMFMKYFASLVSLIFLPKTLIWNKITLPASNSPNLAEFRTLGVTGVEMTILKRA